jgi:hypothetical protein
MIVDGDVHATGSEIFDGSLQLPTIFVWVDPEFV